MTTATTKTYLLDVNVLIALAWPQHVHHDRAHRWFDRVEQPWATTPVTEAGFVRLTINPNVVGERIPASQAIAALEVIRQIPLHVFIPDEATFAEPSISLDRLASPRQVTDLHLVNLAARVEAVLATLDRGISEALIPSDRMHVFVLP